MISVKSKDECLIYFTLILDTIINYVQIRNALCPHNCGSYFILHIRKTCVTVNWFIFACWAKILHTKLSVAINLAAVILTRLVPAGGWENPMTMNGKNVRFGQRKIDRTLFRPATLKRTIFAIRLSSIRKIANIVNQDDRRVYRVVRQINPTSFRA